MTASTGEDRNAPGAKVRVPPPLLFLSVVISGVVLQRVLGGSLPLSRPIGFALGAVLALTAGTLVLWAGGLFKKTGQDVRPWLNTPELITTGVYRFTRNPMYVSMALLQAGLGLSMRSPWLLGLLPVSIVAVYLTAIRAEERYLEEKFGDSYVEYKRRVRRWL